MSPPMPQGCRTLGEYITELVARLRAGEPRLFQRLRQVVGDRRARMTLDDESVVVEFKGDRLEISPDVADSPVAGDGGCDRETTLRLLGGYGEVTGAILEGSLRASGDIESLARIFQAIEILLDASSRNPSLVALSRSYSLDPCRPRPRSAFPRVERDPIVMQPSKLPAFERALLNRLDLLP